MRTEQERIKLAFEDRGFKLEQLGGNVEQWMRSNVEGVDIMVHGEKDVPPTKMSEGVYVVVSPYNSETVVLKIFFSKLEMFFTSTYNFMRAFKKMK